jgi:hypothetical protein
LKSRFPWVITHLPWQTHNSPRIEAQTLVSQGTWEVEILNQVTQRKKGFESSNQGAPIKGRGASRRLGFSPGDKGLECLGENWLGQRRGLSDNPQERFHSDLLSLGKLQLPRQLAYRNCIGTTFSFVICVLPLKKKGEEGSKLRSLG